MAVSGRARRKLDQVLIDLSTMAKKKVSPTILIDFLVDLYWQWRRTSNGHKKRIRYFILAKQSKMILVVDTEIGVVKVAIIDNKIRCSLDKTDVCSHCLFVLSRKDIASTLDKSFVYEKTRAIPPQLLKPKEEDDYEAEQL